MNYYQTLIQLRKSEPALKTLNRKSLSVDVNSDKQTLVMHRWHEECKIVCLMNFSDEANIVSLDKAADWKLLINSADMQWAGPGEVVIESNTVKLHPQSVVVLKN